jgi:hypothetical protein
VVSISPTQATAGGTLSVNGSNFAPNAVVDITFNFAPTTASGTTDENGALAPLAVTVPSVSAGVYVVTISDRTSRYPVSSTVTVK